MNKFGFTIKFTNMNDVQTNRVNSLIKSSDFLDDHASELAAVTQIAPLALELKNLIKDIETAAGKGSLDLTGVAEQKSITRQNLIDITMKVARGAAAYYQSVNQLRELRMVDFNNTEMIKKRDNDLYATAKELHQMAIIDGSNYIAVSAPDITLLDDTKEKFFDYIQDPKREVEIVAQQNAMIDPYITQGMEIRKKLDIYMQTFIAIKAILYNEWNASLSIDDTGANTPASYTVTLMIPPTSLKSIDYSSVALQGNTEIKLINNSAAELVYGFGNDSNSFAGTQTVYSNTQKRQSATSLGYNALSATILNVQNNQAVDLECTIEIYDMS
jgi:hypothetical protein